ncbi:hypothetical protein BaRGS_00033346 [Batillaria attramentaria]|uniref:Uncharacterized protein n=1 Tax=Batillaria attramentaria TaxID=370345 RepID=A0ABD0JL48_9CAEN
MKIFSLFALFFSPQSRPPVHKAVSSFKVASRARPSPRGKTKQIRDFPVSPSTEAAHFGCSRVQTGVGGARASSDGSTQPTTAKTRGGQMNRSPPTGSVCGLKGDEVVGGSESRQRKHLSSSSPQKSVSAASLRVVTLLYVLEWPGPSMDHVGYLQPLPLNLATL